MWHAFFLAVGIGLSTLGAECLVIDEAVMNRSARPVAERSFLLTKVNVGNSQKTIRPPEWAPWAFLSIGIVIVLYSFTLPQRNAG